MVVIAVVITLGLRVAAIKNLVNYEKNLMLLLIGSLSAEDKARSVSSTEVNNTES